MNGIVHRSHFSIRLGDVSPEIRKNWWHYALSALLVALTIIGGSAAITMAMFR